MNKNQQTLAYLTEEIFYQTQQMTQAGFKRLRNTKGEVIFAEETDQFLRAVTNTAARLTTEKFGMDLPPVTPKFRWSQHDYIDGVYLDISSHKNESANLFVAKEPINKDEPAFIGTDKNGTYLWRKDGTVINFLMMPYYRKTA